MTGLNPRVGESFVPATFTVDSRFNKDAEYKKVRFGKDGRLLEVELNELQDIQNHRMARLASTIFGSRALYVGNYAVSSGRLTITNEYVVIDGEVLFIPTAPPISISLGDSIYVNRLETTLGKTDTIRRYGNIGASETVPNHMQDDRINIETTKRLQVQYQLTKTNTGSGTFVKICDIVNVSGQPTVQKMAYSDSMLLALARSISLAEINTFKSEVDNKDIATLNNAKKYVDDALPDYAITIGTVKPSKGMWFKVIG